MKSKIDVSIIILNYNGKKIIKSLLSLIKKLNFPKNRLETIIVDNNSSDSSIDFFKKNYPKIKLVKLNNNLGYSALNKAIPHCKGKYIFFLNNDVQLEKNCIRALIKIIKKDKKIKIAVPTYINYFDRNKIELAGDWGSRSFYFGALYNQKNPCEIIGAGMGMIKKEALKKIKYLFDPDYFLYGEDVDLGLRVRLTGGKVMYAPKAILYHMESATTKKISKMHRLIFLTERNILITFFKIVSFKNLILLLPYVSLMRFVNIVKDIFLLRPMNAYARLKAVLWILFHPVLICKKRIETQKIRIASDKYVLGLMKERYLFIAFLRSLI